MKATTTANQTQIAPKRPRKAKCSWCGTAFETTHATKEFCAPAHKQEYANFCASRGKVLFPIAMAWRTQRGRKGIGADAMAEMERFLDACAAELTAQGAPPIAHHYKASRQFITPWFDDPRRRPQRDRLAQSPPAEE